MAPQPIPPAPPAPPSQPGNAAAPPVHKPPATIAACGRADVKVSAERGDASTGQQFSTVTVVALRTCRLPGTPGVHTTDAGGRTLRTATASTGAASPVVVQGGYLVTALVHGPTTCNAPISAYLVVSPAAGVASTLAVPLRACALVVDHYRG